MSDGMAECPECGDAMYADEDWKLVDEDLAGSTIGSEGIDGDYAHARCLTEGNDA